MNEDVKIYARIDENNKILGWYSSDVHGDNIPEPNIEVSREQHRIALSGNHNAIDESGVTRVEDFRSDAERQEAFEKESKLNNKRFNQIISNHIDSAAQSLDYDDLQACLKYVVYENIFKEECERLLRWNQAVWEYIVENDVGNYFGVVEIDQLIDSLPKLEDF